MHTQMLIRLIVGLGGTAIIALLAVRRVLWLVKLTLSGQPVTGRTDDVGARLWAQISEVLGQRRLLKWSIPGVAHLLTMWGFFILITVYLEALRGAVHPQVRTSRSSVRWEALGFLQDFFAVAVLLGIIDVRDHPAAVRTQGVRPRRPASTVRIPVGRG